MMRRAIGLLLFLCVSSASSAQLAPGTWLKQHIDQFVLALMVSGQDIARPAFSYRLVEETVSPLLDFNAIANGVLGRHRNRLSRAQQQQFSASFQAYLLYRMSLAVTENSQQIIDYSRYIRIQSERLDRHGRDALVKLEIALPGAPPVPLQLRMRRETIATDWLITDLHVLGLSYLSDFRRRLHDTVRRLGIDRVLARYAGYQEVVSGK